MLRYLFGTSSEVPFRLVYVGCLLLLRLLDSEFKCAHQTRLETRTKESNMYASRRVENLKAQ